MTTPSFIDRGKTLSTLWAIERNDGRGLVLWLDHTQKEPGGEPIACLLLWTRMEHAERYNVEALHNTGRPFPIPPKEIIPTLRKIMATGVKWAFLNTVGIDTAERENRAAYTSVKNLIEYLEKDGRLDRG